MSLAATSKSAARGKRALISTAAVLIAGLAVLMGGVGGASATSLATASTTTTETVSTSSIAAGSPVTFGATVTASDGTVPTGIVQFVAHYTAVGSSSPSLISLGQTNLTPGTSSSTASLTTSSLAAGAYQVTAQYSPNGSINWNGSSSPASSLTVSSTSLATTSLGFTESTDTIDAGASVTFTTTLSTAAGDPTPTGTVFYSAGPDVNHGNSIGQAPVQNGSSTLTVSGWSAGTYVIVANYGGDSVYATATSSALTLTVNAVSVAVTTSTTVTLTPSTITEGESVTIAAHIVKVGLNNPPPGGPIVTFVGGIAGSDQSTWVTVGIPGQATLDANGNASETVGGWSPGTYTIAAQYPGDVTDAASSGSATLTVLPDAQDTATTLTYTGATSAAWHDTATLGAHLTGAGGNPVANETVTLAIGSDSCSGATDGNGNVSCQITVNSLPGSTTATATFAGDSSYSGTNTSHVFTIATRPTALSATNVTASAGGAATLSATLTDQETGADVVGAAVTLGVGANTCTGVTNNLGVATCQITSGAGQIAATFAGGGSTGYAGSSSTATLTILQILATTTTYTGDTQDLAGSTATLSANVSPAPDGGTVTFTLGTQSCTAPAAGGTASCTIALNQAAGTGYTVNVAYGGDLLFQSSSTSSPFAIVAPTTTATHVAPISPILAGASATLSATVSPSAAPGTVTFSTGSTTLCTATLSAGSASCSASFAQPGSYTVTASYGGNGVYPASSDSTTAIVYAFAPGGGSFVVGDKTDTGSVTFWGAQWAKVNGLSLTPAPSAFKGFAVYPSTPSCGSIWSTDPGNSSSPPAGPLPAYMAVIDTSASAQLGSLIFGNTIAIVIVKTNAGYKNDPGHAGTGTVVATLCSGGSSALPKLSTKLAYTGGTQGTAGSPATLSATLTDANGNPLANETVTLSVGSQSCTDTTDSSGNASCTVTLNQSAGTYPVTATFAGDSGYSSSSASASFAVASVQHGGKGSTCRGSFNGTSIGRGDTVWFSSVLKVGGLPSTGATITFTGQTITFGGQTIAVPDAKVVFSRWARQATTSFVNGVWVTTVPAGLGGNVFLSGLNLALPKGLGGGLQNVSWTGTFSSDTPGVSVNWQWGAAAYNSFGDGPGSLDVKPVDDPSSSGWQNSDRAGTPEGWSSHVTGGATGGGGSNYTGSYSGTSSVGF